MKIVCRLVQLSKNFKYYILLQTFKVFVHTTRGKVCLPFYRTKLIPLCQLNDESSWKFTHEFELGLYYLNFSILTGACRNCRLACGSWGVVSLYCFSAVDTVNMDKIVYKA